MDGSINRNIGQMCLVSSLDGSVYEGILDSIENGGSTAMLSSARQIWDWDGTADDIVSIPSQKRIKKIFLYGIKWIIPCNANMEDNALYEELDKIRSVNGDYAAAKYLARNEIVLPCPYCGNKEVEYQGGADLHRIVCPCCNCRTGYYESWFAAETAWNAIARPPIFEQLDQFICTTDD